METPVGKEYYVQMVLRTSEGFSREIEKWFRKLEKETPIKIEEMTIKEIP